MATEPNGGHGRPGLHKSPELIVQAREETAATIARIMLMFVGVALFCVLSLLTPDAALLTGGARLDVPFARPVSFRGFIIGPALLIALRLPSDLVEHYRRLEPLRRQVPAQWVPLVGALQNPLLRTFVGFVLYLLLPLTMLAFTWKAAVLPAWGTGLVGVTVAVIVGHLVLPARWLWRGRALLIAAVAIFPATIAMWKTRGPIHQAMRSIALQPVSCLLLTPSDRRLTPAPRRVKLDARRFVRRNVRGVCEGRGCVPSGW